MEPTAILHLISACLGVTKGAVSAIHGLYEAQQLYGDAKTALLAIEIKLSTLDFTLAMLQAWAEQLGGFRSFFPGFVEQLGVQIQGCLGVISAVRTKIEFKQDLGRREKARFVWNESSIRGLERALDSQVQALQTLLLVSQFTDASRQRERMQAAETVSIFSVARETASVYGIDLDSIATELADREFAFDDEVVNSRVYRAAFRQLTARRVRGGELEQELASSKEPNGAGEERAAISQHDQKDREDGRIEMKSRVIGQDDKDLDSLNILADLEITYYEQGRWAEAEKLGVHVMQTREKVLGREHPDTLCSISNLAHIYYKQGRLVEAEKLETQVIETRVLGEDHPNTLLSITNLAAAYYKQGRLAESEKLEMQVMETRKRVLGEEHPKTLISMYDLAHRLKSLGRKDDAISQLNDYHRIQQRILGSTHPKFLKADALLREWSSSS